MEKKLPSCIKPSRIGLGETEYDFQGMPAPVTWTCGCGSRLTLETYDYDLDGYKPVSRLVKSEFLDSHLNCIVTCYKCHNVEVERTGQWCQDCEDKEADIW
jgi:hypothetical protein